MQMQNQKEFTRKIKKSQLLLIGSLLVFVGCFVLTRDYFIKMKEEVFTEMELETLGNQFVESGDTQEEITEVPIVNNLPEDNTTDSDTNEAQGQNQTITQPTVDYSKYLGVLEIPKIGLKRGFYNIDSRYNDIKYNVSMVKGSTLPDVVNGNLILMAHSGWSSISYFEYLYNLKIGDYAYVTYNGKKYSYKLVNIYDVEKNGNVKIIRSYSKTTLTLITCTRNSDTLQTVYILELV